ncbi:hypothetical protein N9R79_09180 [Vibrio sp.]|nr:hypothetical protein [Vibrio sp.]
MVTVDTYNEVTLKLSHTLAKSKKYEINAYLFVPGELQFSPQVISEKDFYYGAISQKHSYFSSDDYLPLVHSRLAKRGRLSTEQYRVSLSLFAYQYAVALKKSTNKLKTKKEDITQDDIDEVLDLALDILKRLRRSIPGDETLNRYYENIDNYLSWFTEQQFLSLASSLNRGEDYKTLKNRLITIAEKETAHRRLRNYNSKTVQNDMIRLTNKMRLLRRLIEYPIVLKNKTKPLGDNMNRAAKGFATGLVMVFVTLSAILARDYWGEITASFIIMMSFIYALREIFKDDLRDLLVKWNRKGKPKWKKKFFDPNTKHFVGEKLEWLDFKNITSLPDAIRTIRKKRVVQKEEQILHYRAQVHMATSHFLSGYDQTKESLIIDMRTFMRLMGKGSNLIYLVNNGQVSKEKVERRQLLNLIVQVDDADTKESHYYRWKIVISRHKIVSIEEIAKLPPLF